MSEGALFGDAAHEHGNSGANIFIDINDEGFFLRAQEHGKTSLKREDRAQPDFDDLIVHGWS